MTFREFMQENGYELQTTFWNDFSIADRFGLSTHSTVLSRSGKKTTSISPSWYWCSITKFGSIMKKGQIMQRSTTPSTYRLTSMQRRT